MNSTSDFDFFEDRYPKRTRKPINKSDALDDLEDEVFFQKQKLMSHCVYDIQEIVGSEEFKDDMVLKMPDALGFNLEYIKQHGLSIPLLFEVPAEQLGMTVPDAESFTVFDVLELAGKERKIEVVEVNEQKGRTMKLSDFVKYYTCSPEYRRELLNVLSLEFSMTNLAKHIKPPSFVTEIDWIDNVWPKELFERQKIHMKTNQFSDFSTYPKVQRYCLMSVANCFTDFHIDFGGTSVWYHVLKGKKIFWLIEPTEENLLLYEEWIMGGNNSESFFGRIVNKCNRIELSPGMTFIIPSGWIHCVFTPEDSLVFGGNFLHSYSMGMQIRVVKSEDKIRVGSKYRFPHFKQMIWYVIENIVRKATDRIYLKPIKPKAYLADLHHFDVQIMPDGDEEELADDQEPCCSSAVEAGCKKSGLIKDSKSESGYVGIGMEESESDTDGEAELSEITNDPNICYDDMPNGSDNCYMLVPTQMKFSSKNYEKFVPVTAYNEEFLSTVSSTEVNGYVSLLEFTKKLIKTRKPEVGEGITRPKHLIAEFEHLLNHIRKGGKCDLNLEYELRGSASEQSNIEQTRELIVAKRVYETVWAKFKEPSKKRNKRKLQKGEDTKTITKTGKQAKRSIDAMPILVDGLPHPLQSEDPPLPNPYGFNPLETVVPLGQKPLPSAYRRGVNMAQLPPSQRFRLKKKDELNESFASVKSEMVDVSLNSTTISLNSVSSTVSKSDEKSLVKNLYQQLPVTNAGLAYKSPLQYKERKPQVENQEKRQRQFYQERQQRIEEQRKRKMEEEKRRLAETETPMKHEEEQMNVLCPEKGITPETSAIASSDSSNQGFSQNSHSCQQLQSSFDYNANSYNQSENRNNFRRGSNQFRGRGSQQGPPFYGRRGGQMDTRSGGFSGKNRGRGEYGCRHYDKKKYNNNNSRKRHGGSRWNNNNCNNRGRGGGFNLERHQPFHLSYSPFPPGQFVFPPMLSGQHIPPNEVLAQWGMPPIPDAYRQYGLPQFSMLPPPPVSVAPSNSNQKLGQLTVPQAFVASPPGIVSTTVSGKSFFSSNSRYSTSTKQQPMNEEDSASSSNLLYGRQKSVSVSSVSANNVTSPVVRGMDGFEGINEIDRLTKMMGSGDAEDVDLRDHTMFSKNVSSTYAKGGDREVPRDTLSDPRLNNSSGLNDHITSTGDPSTDIDEIFRLTQMYTA